MAAWRILAGWVVALTVVGTAQAQTYSLKEAPLKGSYSRVQIKLALTGEMQVRQEDKVLPLRQQAEAVHDFAERVLEADDSGVAQKTARFYKNARAVITIGAGNSVRTFRPERCLMVAQRYKDQPLTYCPNGPLTREELELTDHFDTLTLPGLLPGKDVAVGETWKVGNSVAQALCAFDGLTAQDLTCKLENVKDDVASVTIAGTASGIDHGASVKLDVSGSGTFDLQTKRLTALTWKQNDQREQGPASPALKADLTVTLERSPLEAGAVTELGDFALVPVPQEWTPPESMTQLSYADPKGRYELTLARDWQLVARTDEHLVLRLLDRGDFVAQATLTPWKKAAKGEHLSEDAFKEAMAASPGWEQEEVKDAKDKDAKVVETQKGYWTCFVHAVGQLNGLKAVQYFYLVAGPEGDQLVVTFTMTPAQVQMLDTRDLALVRTITFPSRPPEGPQAKAAP